jgi:hypothetical protein
LTDSKRLAADNKPLWLDRPAARLARQVRMGVIAGGRYFDRDHEHCDFAVGWLPPEDPGEGTTRQKVLLDKLICA